MAKKEAPKIQTERLVLRPRAEKDFPNMIKMFNNDEVREFLGINPPRDEHSMLEMVRNRTETKWAVTLKDTDEFIGDVMIPEIAEGYLGEIGYRFMREHWGCGFAYEAVSAVIEHCKSTLNLKRLCATIDNKNMPSKKLIEKLRFTLVAVLPESNLRGRVADIAYYSRIV
ncbi:GNAT family N-acetyltransferase [Rossellomorea aquimaris]|uniref:GNAT family N-acetyltransferase n=1 Tax=Rossellomorea aquimaris TaxID=189382 RepID=UPI0011E8CEB0|nr:GNAT family N-acetyltransferase [Rossellomorea aquimaris]TYS86170.1 GNAT family N-acetyltransferase [Rossellomorea aquimaris]